MGLTPPIIHLDGKLHRFASGLKGEPGKGDKTGWYIAFGDGIAAGRFGCWRAGVEVAWRADIGRVLSTAEEMANSRRMAEARKLRDAEVAKGREVAADTVGKIWVDCTAADPAHPYLMRKGIQTNGARVTGDGRLVIPLYNDAGALTSLQYIDDKGGKLFQAGGQASGSMWIVGTMDDPGILYIAEGFATAATIHECTNRPCVVAYSASNLPAAATAMRERYGAAQDIVIVADNDDSGTGQRYAEQASVKTGARFILPPTLGDVNDYAQAGGNLMALLQPPVSDWLIPADDFAQSPAPIRWLVKHWLQDQALIMVHGPSGGGKTFVVLDWCLSIAAGLPEWHGNRTRPGSVVYLAGEGHHGLRGRVAVWREHNRPGPLSMWLSRDGCDLNTPEGYRRVVDNIRALPSVPCLIVVDTLHRFLAGDENSAMDTKTMLDACAGIMAEFNCSVLLVHHTGVSDEAQHRARGSSAWKGALEIEISIVPAKEGRPMEIVQRKAKDSEMAQPVYANLVSVPIPGWLDDDGEQVTSAVVVASEGPSPRAKESKVEGHRKQWERAWWASGAEDRDGAPYLSRSALKDALSADGMAERTIRNMTNPSYTDKLIGALTLAEVIAPLEHGWIMVDQVHSSAMIMRKNC